MRKMFLVLITLGCFISTPGLADQTDNRLTNLFSDLLIAADESDANEIEAFIWLIWVEHDDNEIRLMMDEGMYAMAAGNLHLALNIFDKVVERKPDFAEAWNKKATVNYMLRNWDQSVSDIERTLQLEPRHFGALAGLGLILYHQKNYHGALHAFREVLKIYPMSDSSRRNIEVIEEQIVKQAI